jgi:fused signal recognition particle receptor
MGIFDKFRKGLQKTQNKLTHEIRRIITRSPRLDRESLEELENALIGADFGIVMTSEIMAEVKKAFETQGAKAADVFAVAEKQIAASFAGASLSLKQNPAGATVISMVGVNGTGKTTTAAKLAARLKAAGHKPLLAACDTFRAAAIEQLRTWGERLNVEVIASSYGADAAAVAHDAVTAAKARQADYLIVDTAGRLHTKHNLMQELQKLHRVIGRQLPGAPHEVLLVIDATTGMNALPQAREFHKAVPLTGLVITKLDGTSKAGMVVSIHRELKIPIKFVGLGEQADDLQVFDPAQYATALFAE